MRNSWARQHRRNGWWPGEDTGAEGSRRSPRRCPRPDHDRLRIHGRLNRLRPVRRHRRIRRRRGTTVRGVVALPRRATVELHVGDHPGDHAQARGGLPRPGGVHVTIQQVLQKVGRWSLRLKPGAPPGVLSSLTPFGHIVVIPGRVNPVERGDECLSLARYVGIFREMEASPQVTLAGVGLEAWLGDEDGKGDVIESPGIALSGATFAASVNAIAPACLPVGTVYSGVPGTVTNTFLYQSRRTALDYLCSVMGGEWRVNNTFSLDAGPRANLFVTTPRCLIVRKDLAGYDQQVRAVRGDLSSTQSWKDFTTRTVIVSQALGSGTADAATVPYKDAFGNAVKFTRIVDEVDETSSVNAASRAQSVLNLFAGSRRGVRLSVADFDVAGDFAPGDSVYVFDPDSGLYDTAVEVPFRGRLLNPMAVRVLSVSWPVTDQYTVGFRISPSTVGGSPTWIDLTPWVEAESGAGEIEVADSQVPALTNGIGGLGTQVAGGGGGAGDTAVPNAPVFGAFTTTSYQPDDGLSRAAVKLTWTQPTNTDGSTIVDGDRYEIRYRPTGTTDWQITAVPFDQLSATVTNLPPSTGFDWQIRCVDYATPTNYGACSATTAYTTADDVTAPATPAAATVAASLIAVQVTHQLGLAAGGTFNLPLDMDHLEVHLGASSGFTPDASSLAGKLQATGAMVSGGVAAVGTFPTSSTSAVYVKVIAVDKTGNRSPASSAASATATLIDNAHISDLTASKITAGTISTAILLAGSIKTGTSGARTEQDSNGIRLYNSAGTNTFDASTATGTVTLTGKIQTGTTGCRVVIDPATTDIRFYPRSGSAVATVKGVGVDMSGAGPASTLAWMDARSSPGTGSAYANLLLSSYNTGSFRSQVLMSARQGDDQTSAWVNLQDSATDSLKASIIGVADESGVTMAHGTWFSGGVTMQHDSSGSTMRLQSGFANLVHASGTEFYATSGEARVYAPTGGNANLQTGSGNYVSVNDAGGVGAGVYISGPTIYIGHSSGNNVRSDAIYNNTATFTANVGIATTPIGRLYRLTSSARYKVAVSPVDGVGLADVISLLPVTYYDRGQAEAQGGSTEGLSQHVGLIAEQAASHPTLGSWLVERDEDGDPESVNYERLGVVVIAALQEVATRLAVLEGKPAPRLPAKTVPKAIRDLSKAPRKIRGAVKGNP